ncbi:hypothetical protein WKH10_11705 [Pantoea agglomerans]|jgi:hypothetical protein|uniref:hypothetical protein n=1 Tax=Enterobacter agglomerans TaxID=549 RepID=UPI003C7A14F8
MLHVQHLMGQESGLSFHGWAFKVIYIFSGTAGEQYQRLGYRPNPFLYGTFAVR